MTAPTYSRQVDLEYRLQGVAGELAELIALLDETTPEVVFEQLRDAHEHLTTARHEIVRRR